MTRTKSHGVAYWPRTYAPPDSGTWFCCHYLPASKQPLFPSSAASVADEGKERVAIAMIKVRISLLCAGDNPPTAAGLSWLHNPSFAPLAEPDDENVSGSSSSDSEVAPEPGRRKREQRCLLQKPQQLRNKGRRTYFKLIRYQIIKLLHDGTTLSVR